MAETMPQLVIVIDQLNTQQLDGVRIESGPTGGVVVCLGNDPLVAKPYRVYTITSTGTLSGRLNYTTLDEAMVDYIARRDAAV
jgi:hypothetical protein